MTKVKSNNGNEQKSNIFPWEIFRSDVIYFFAKKYTKILMTIKIEVSALWLKWSQTMVIKQNHTFSMRHIQIWHHFSFGHKLLKYVNDFYNCHLSILLQRWTQTRKEAKLSETCAHLTVFLHIYKVINYLNDFWNLFLVKVHLKNEWIININHLIITQIKMKLLIFLVFS